MTCSEVFQYSSANKTMYDIQIMLYYYKVTEVEM